MVTKYNERKVKRKLGMIKKVLLLNEMNVLLTWFRNDTSGEGLVNYTILYMLASGLRCEELYSLRWKDLWQFKVRRTAVFIEKGGKEAEQETL